MVKVEEKYDRIAEKPYWVATCGWFSRRSKRAAAGHMGRCKYCKEGVKTVLHLDPELTSISLQFTPFRSV